MDVAYLLRTVSSAMLNEEWRPRAGTRGRWNYTAEYEVLDWITPPVLIQEMRACPDLKNFSALRRSMQGSFFRVGPQESMALWELFDGETESDNEFRSSDRTTDPFPNPTIAHQRPRSNDSLSPQLPLQSPFVPGGRNLFRGFAGDGRGSTAGKSRAKAQASLTELSSKR